MQSALYTNKELYRAYTMINEKAFIEIVSGAIRKNRRLKQLSCEKLAELAEIDYSTINLIENGRQLPNSYTLYKVFQALDIDILAMVDNQNLKSEALENSLYSKIKNLNDESKEAIIKFINSFVIKSK